MNSYKFISDKIGFSENYLRVNKDILKLDISIVAELLDDLYEKLNQGIKKRSDSEAG